MPGRRRVLAGVGEPRGITLDLLATPLDEVGDVVRAWKVRGWAASLRELLPWAEEASGLGQVSQPGRPGQPQ